MVKIYKNNLKLKKILKLSSKMMNIYELYINILI